jgi:hypothetical protein
VRAQIINDFCVLRIDKHKRAINAIKSLNQHNIVQIYRWYRRPYKKSVQNAKQYQSHLHSQTVNPSIMNTKVLFFIFKITKSQNLKSQLNQVIFFFALVAVAFCAPVEDEAVKQKRHLLAAYPGAIAAPWGWNGAYPYTGAWNGAYLNGAWNGLGLGYPYAGLPAVAAAPAVVAPGAAIIA